MSAFAPKLAALPTTQQALWPSLSQVPKGFVLYGGTALALRLGHRQSVDFDFFTSDTFSPTDLQAAIRFLEEGTIAQGEPNALTVWVRPLPSERAVKVSFFGGIGFPVIDRPDRPDPRGIVIASLRDLAGTKAKVINQRVELRDYLDIAALLGAGMNLPQIVAASVAIFPGQVDYLSTMSAISYFEDGESKSFPEPLKKKLRAAARNASPGPVPEISYASIVASAAAVGR
jgi:hypothetical protein